MSDQINNFHTTSNNLFIMNNISDKKIDFLNQ